MTKLNFVNLKTVTLTFMNAVLHCFKEKYAWEVRIYPFDVLTSPTHKFHLNLIPICQPYWEDYSPKKIQERLMNAKTSNRRCHNAIPAIPTSADPFNPRVSSSFVRLCCMRSQKNNKDSFFLETFTLDRNRKLRRTQTRTQTENYGFTNHGVST